VASGIAWILFIALFLQADLGVFGLPVAIVAMCLGVASVVFSTVVINRKEVAGGRS
jgi:hypothetical protein